MNRVVFTKLRFLERVIKKTATSECEWNLIFFLIFFLELLFPETFTLPFIAVPTNKETPSTLKPILLHTRKYTERISSTGIVIWATSLQI